MNKDTTTEKLIDISISLSSEIDLNKLLEKIVYELRTIFKADGGSLYLRENNQLRFEIAQNDTLKRLKGKDYPFQYRRVCRTYWVCLEHPERLSSILWPAL